VTLWPESWGLEERRLFGGLAGLGIFVFCLIGLHPILDTSEARYALVALRMTLSGDWVTPTIDGMTPFWGKPPLAFWMTAISMHAFGLNEFSARFPVFLSTAASVALVVWSGHRMRGPTFGLIAGLVFASMAFSVLMSAYVLTDQVMSLGATLAMISFWVAVSERGRMAGYIFFIALAVTILAKGLVGIALVGISLFIWLTYERRWSSMFGSVPVFRGGLILAALVLPWYVLAEQRTPGFARYFFLGEHLQKYLVPGWAGDLYGVGRERSIGWIWPFAFVGSLPWSLLVLVGMLRRRLQPWSSASAQFSDPWTRFLLIWAIAPLVFFTFARNGGLPYALPSLPPVALLITQFLTENGYKNRTSFILLFSSLMPAVLAVVTATMFLLPDVALLPTQRQTLLRWALLRKPADEKIAYVFVRPYSADFYTSGNALLAATPDDAVRIRLDRNQTFFAVPARCFILLSDDFRERFDRVAEQNGTVLFEARAGNSDRRAASWPNPTPDQISKAKGECLLTHPP
jgi:4-amino-4-deoxy-L-arabinose transferase-like glycosyltransferase